MEGGHVLRLPLEFEVDVKGKSEAKRASRRQVEEERVTVVLSRKDALC